ncbi:VOC family protein [Conexibacter stalactiti]|uniref:VOC family protein n=1 Tax=Conexibacter stalactiti TaxID=1940611 RepID=A0ABU4HQ68_9ACTN|nr:VOC family protein [Conexibacter stalactiti]MDW5594847.1 VOC family protein [Conexibacter stalactiti]MEC5035489.1 VOC family protein [Conexibacter stalactiti]
MSTPVGRVGHVLLPADDVGASIGFLTEVLGFGLRFRDGDRYAAIDGGGTTLAVAAKAEQPRADQVAVGIRVADLDAVAARLEAAGTPLLGAIAESEHERRLSFLDPAGNVFVAYEPKVS